MRSLLFLILCPIIVEAQINSPFISKANLYYTKLEASGEGMFGFEKDGKFGYIDKNEKVVIPPIYSYENSYSGIPLFNHGYVKIKQNGKYGALDKTGKVAIPFDYESLYFLSHGNVASVSNNSDGKNIYGIVNMQNKVIVPIEYEQFQIDSNLVAYKQNGKWGLMDIAGKKILPAEYDALTPYAKDKVVLAKKGTQYGYIDLTGKWLFEKPASVYILYGSHYGMINCVVNSKYGFLDLKGNEVIITHYDYADQFESNGLAKAGNKKPGSYYVYQYGFVDKSGKEVIPVKYDSIGTFSNGLVYVKDLETNRYGYMNKTGAWVIKPVYLKAETFDDLGGAWVMMTDAKYHYINRAGKDLGVFNENDYKNFNKDGYAVVENAEYPYVLIDKTGKVITKIEDCDGIYNYSEGIAGYKCKSNGLYGFVDYNGKKVIPCEYTGFTGFHEGVSKVSKTINNATKSGYINNKGAIILPVEYDNVSAFRDGWGLIKKDSDYFFVDKAGNLKAPPRKYNNLYEFRSGFALGIIKGTDKINTYYYINTQLKEEFSIEAEQAYSFWESVAVVYKDNLYSLINKKGEMFIQLDTLEQLKFCNDGMLGIKRNGKWGFINDKGNPVVEIKYDDCDSYDNGYGRVKKNGKWGIVDKTGKEIFETQYDNIVPCDNNVFIYYDKSWYVMDKTGKSLSHAGYYSISVFEKDRALAKPGKSYSILKSPLAK